MSESEIEIVIKCKCGKLLTEMKRETESMYGDRLVISVEPCGDCLDEQRDAGYVDCMADYDIGDDYNDD
jgi:hypothetical protein